MLRSGMVGMVSLVFPFFKCNIFARSAKSRQVQSYQTPLVLPSVLTFAFSYCLFSAPGEIRLTVRVRREKIK